MLKWFSISGIRQEMSKVRWPKRKEMIKDVTTVLSFIVIFGVIFEVMNLVVGIVLKYLGL